MLTVKVHTGNGLDFIEETLFVQFLHALGEPSYVSYKPMRQEYFRDVKEGDIWVMNENGKTIANYHLYPEPCGDSSEDKKKREVESGGSKIEKCSG
jgi:hypothetical protein